jgi:putative protease
MSISHVHAQSDFILESSNTPLKLHEIESECRKWAGTPYTCVECEVRVDASAFVNAKMVRKLRQECLTMMTVSPLSAFKGVCDTPQRASEGVRAYCHTPILHTPQVFKSANRPLIETLVAQKPESIVVQNLGALRVLQKMDTTGIRLVGGPALGACNSLAAEWLRTQGLEAVASAYEAAPFAPAPAFHTEFCPITQWAGNGKRFPHCGRPCKRAHWQVVDHKGKIYEVQTDEACRTTVWGTRLEYSTKL